MADALGAADYIVVAVAGLTALIALSILTYMSLATAAADPDSISWLNVDFPNGFGLFGVGIGMLMKGYRSILAD
ncbi:MAG: hypothetical protein ABJ327_24130 [Litoreibacter sp.]